MSALRYDTSHDENARSVAAPARAWSASDTWNVVLFHALAGAATERIHIGDTMHSSSAFRPCALIVATAAVALGAPRTSAAETLRLPVTRDTWFSNVGDEANCNTGGSNRLKLKSIQEMSLVDIDVTPLKGRVVEKATLHLRGYGKERLHRVTVSSFASEWTEGTAPSYKQQDGSSSHNARRHPNATWAYSGSDLCAVMLHQGGTIWGMADATPPDADGWQHIAVSPRVVAARVAGVSHGFLLFDDTGSEWEREGESFTFRHFPNRFVHSRESGEGSAPYFTVELGEADSRAPAAPTDLRADATDLPAGEAWVSWITPGDQGTAGAVGFVVEVDGEAVPRYLVPAAGPVGEQVRMHLRDTGLKPGQQVGLSVRAVDGAGNVGEAATLRVAVSAKTPPALPGASPQRPAAGGSLPHLGQAEVVVLDALDKVAPQTGVLIPPQPQGYLTANHLWNAGQKQVQLRAARNEFVAFQIAVHGPAPDVTPTLVIPHMRMCGITFSELRNVASEDGPLPDPAVPLRGGIDIPNGEWRSVLCEVYVPHDAKPGEQTGTLRLASGGEQLDFNVTLQVWDFTLPDYLSFLPEMNAYGLPANERGYYRLAHKHRTVLNRVPYSQSGNVHDGCVPETKGNELDWTEWDARFGPYLDGSAFADLPRKGVPLECFYLPLHENWPLPIDENYNGDYWADRAFPESYRRAFVDMSRAYAEHFDAKGWHDTLFQCYQNNKHNFKKNGWSRGSSPWLLDEPANWQDYWALRYFALAFHEGVRAAGGKARMVYRGDISRPQWERDSLEGLLDYYVVGGRAFRKYGRLVRDRKEQFGLVVVDYGTTNAIEDSNMQPVGWCLDSWTLGSDGVLPWQTIGRANSWENADQLSLFYPGDVVGQQDPVPSIRLKAYRRGQQDAEYLTLLAQVLDEPRWAVGESVRRELKLSGTAGGTGFTGGEDAGIIHYSQLRPQDAWALRVRIGQFLSDQHPEPKRKLVDFRTPPRDPAKLRQRKYFVGEPQPTAKWGTAADEAGGTQALTVQGRPAVRDTIIDPELPGRNFGAVRRDNRIKRRDDTNAFLIRFDLATLALPKDLKDAEISRATLHFFVWDPPNQAKLKVCAFPVLTEWHEAAATWQRPAEGRTWKGGATFGFGKDTGKPSPEIIVLPDPDADTVDPPIEYEVDVTETVRAWLSGQLPNYGLALAAVIDRSVDDGNHARFQVLGSEYEAVEFGPKLTVELRQ